MNAERCSASYYDVDVPVLWLAPIGGRNDMKKTPPRARSVRSISKNSKQVFSRQAQSAKQGAEVVTMRLQGVQYFTTYCVSTTNNQLIH
jgi:hypothetical protein